LPETTGVSSSAHASAIPSMTSEKDHITSGRSGEAKFRQLVMASGRAPTQVTLRADSATMRRAPSRGLMAQ
jgi:hypothetical protein